MYDQHQRLIQQHLVLGWQIRQVQCSWIKPNRHEPQLWVPRSETILSHPWSWPDPAHPITGGQAAWHCWHPCSSATWTVPVLPSKMLYCRTQQSNWLKSHEIDVRSCNSIKLVGDGCWEWNTPKLFTTIQKVGIRQSHYTNSCSFWGEKRICQISR